MAQMSFDASQVEPSGSIDVVPPGRYNVIITDSDYVATKSGTGHYLKLTFKIIEGDYVNRLVWANLNLDNPNTKAVEIAQRELSAICHAVDVLSFKDTSDLHGIPLSAQVKIRKGTDGYDDQNTISGFKSVAESDGSDPVDDSPPWS